MVEIRKARLKDLDALIELWKRFMEHQRGLGDDFGEDRLPEMRDNAPDIVRVYFSRTIRSPKGLLLVLEDQRQIKGYMLSNISKNIPIFKKDNVGYISDIYIEEGYRGIGFGKKMFNETKKWFSSKGIQEVSIKVLHYNSDAENIYKNWGFKNDYYDLRLDLD